ncbi:MAG TPA: RHS repeat-associated core domain-containing protein, partial [Terracidiphilus sp.]
MTRAVCANEQLRRSPHFTGKIRDTETGNDYFGARYYANTMGRFMSPDWSAEPTSIPYASLPYPQSLNLYSYVQNNPLSKTDPNGHCDVDGEHHGWFWCAGHALGVTETQKELHADADQFRKTFGWIPGVKNMSDKDALNAISDIKLGISMSVPDVPEGEVGAEAETATQVGTPRATVNGVPQ